MITECIMESITIQYGYDGGVAAMVERSREDEDDGVSLSSRQSEMSYPSSIDDEDSVATPFSDQVKNLKILFDTPDEELEALELSMGTSCRLGDNDDESEDVSQGRDELQRALNAAGMVEHAELFQSDVEESVPSEALFAPYEDLRQLYSDQSDSSCATSNDDTSVCDLSGTWEAIDKTGPSIECLSSSMDDYLPIPSEVLAMGGKSVGKFPSTEKPQETRRSNEIHKKLVRSVKLLAFVFSILACGLAISFASDKDKVASPISLVVERAEAARPSFLRFQQNTEFYVKNVERETINFSTAFEVIGSSSTVNDSVHQDTAAKAGSRRRKPSKEESLSRSCKYGNALACSTRGQLRLPGIRAIIAAIRRVLRRKRR